MGRSDLAGKKWLKDKRRYADLFNGTIFRGKQIIKPEELEITDGEADVILVDKNGKKKAVQRYRDIVMQWKEEVTLALFACENQSRIHYAMPVRMMVYDGMSYVEQIDQIWEKRKESGDIPDLDREEWLSHFGKNDRLTPVISLVFYYGTKEWDASTSLHEMFCFPEVLTENEIVEAYLPNYHINLIDAGNVNEMERFQTDLQLLFQMLKCRGDKEKLLNYVNMNRTYFGKLDRDTFLAFGEFLQAGSLLERIVPENDQNKGDVDMCKALQDLYDDGIKLGIEQGIEQKMCELVTKKLSKGKSAEVIADELEESVEKIREVIKQISMEEE